LAWGIFGTEKLKPIVAQYACATFFSLLPVYKFSKEHLLKHNLKRMAPIRFKPDYAFLNSLISACSTAQRKGRGRKTVMSRQDARHQKKLLRLPDLGPSLAPAPTKNWVRGRTKVRVKNLNN
jgi:hypothetical protein